MLKQALTEPYVIKTHYIRYILDGATDAQLNFLGLTSHERDSVLSKGVSYRTSAVDNVTLGDACFFPAQSLISGASVVSYNQADTFDTAAYEQYYAARFWGKNKAGRIAETFITKPHAAVFSIGLSASALFSVVSPDLGLMAPAVVLANSLYSRNVLLKEAKAATRFSALFDPELYKNGRCCWYNLESDSQKFFKRVNGDLLDHQISDIRRKTAAEECFKGNLIFPKGYKDFEKSYGDFVTKFFPGESTQLKLDKPSYY